MKNNIRMVLFLFFLFTKNNLWSQPTDLSPKIGKVSNSIKEFSPDDKKNNPTFFEVNPDFFINGKYVYREDQTPIYSKDYNALNVTSIQNLHGFNCVQVIFKEFLVLGGFYYPSSKRLDQLGQFNHIKYYDINSKQKTEYQDINEYYKNEVTKILRNKEAKRIFVQDMLLPKVSPDDSISNNLLLEFKLDGLDMLDSKREWPEAATYSISAMNSKGEVVQTFKQIIFFNSKGDVSKKPSDIVIKATIIPAFNCLLNQLLNDRNTLVKLKELHKSQLETSSNHYQDINNIQIKLLNILFNKGKLIGQLKDLGYNIESLSYSNFKGAAVYNSSVPLNTNQMINSTGDLIGNLILSQNNKKEINETKSIGKELIQKFDSLNIAEHKTIESISQDILTSVSVLSLPNTSELNKLMGEATANLKRKDQIASSNLASQIHATMTNNLKDFVIQLSNSLTFANEKQNSESLAVSVGKDGNSPEAKACAEQAQNEWRGTCPYQRANDPSLVRYQQRYAILAKKKIIEIMIQKCSEYISTNEMTAYKEVISGLDSQFNSMGGWDGLDPNCK